MLLADPPWRYEENSVQPYWQIESQYPTLALEEICALRVPAAEQAVLFLWATAPKLPDALQVMAAWGFAYRTNAVWVKHRPGMGYYFRGATEHLIFGVRGKMKVTNKNTRNLITAVNPRRHSEKPACVRDLIVRCSGDVPRIELFARSYPADYLSDTVESLIIAADAGGRVHQVPVTMRPRLAGSPSQSPLRAALYLLRVMMVLVLSVFRRHSNPSPNANRHRTTEAL